MAQVTAVTWHLVTQVQIQAAGPWGKRYGTSAGYLVFNNPGAIPIGSISVYKNSQLRINAGANTTIANTPAVALNGLGCFSQVSNGGLGVFEPE